MAELGVIASIVGIAGVGIKLSKTLYVTGDRALSADHNLRRLATNISLFSASLKHFAQVMKSNEHLYSPEYEQTANQIVLECQGVFEELTKMAFMANQKSDSGSSNGSGSFSTNDSKRKFNLVHRVKVYFQQEKVDWLIAQLEYLKTTLSVLIQTLNLAAVTAKAKEDSQTLSAISSERIEQERIHVETLILARQISVVVLQQQNYRPSDANRADQESFGRISPVPSEDSTGEPNDPKLLMQDATPAMSVVKLGRGNLEFLDSAMPKQSQVVPPTMFKSHNQIIDQLLGRWTRLQEMEGDINERNRKEIDLEEQTVEDHYEMVEEASSLVEMKKRDVAAPNLKLQLVDSLEGSMVSSSLVSSPSPASPETNYLNPLATNGRPAAQTPPPPVAHTSYPLPPQSALGSSVNTNLDLQRSVTTPNPPTPAHPQIPPSSPRPSNFNALSTYPAQQTQMNPYAPPPLLFDNTPISSAASNIAYNDQSSRPNSSHQSATRNPYGAQASPAESPYGSSPDSDGEGDDRNRRLGLGIPWRISIGAKYWDFLDERLVGPRTPYLPTEPMSWLYSHDYAHTEIAEKWVCEEAIAERNYLYTQIPRDDGNLNNTWGRNQAWRIKCPLKFKEIDALVERTIDIYRRRTTVDQVPPPLASRGLDGAVRSNPVPIPLPPPPPYLAGMPPQMPQPKPHLLPQEVARQKADAFNAWQQMNSSQNQRSQQLPQPQPPQRAVSFQDMSHPPPRPGNLRTDYVERSPRLSGDFSSTSMVSDARGVYWGPPSSNGPSSSVAGIVGTGTGPGYAAATSAPRTYRERERERDQNRPPRERFEDDLEDHDRQRRKTRGIERDKKKKKSNTAITLAKVGGLMAMLDGLDGII